MQRDRLWKMGRNCRTWVINRKAYIEVILGSVYLIQTLVLSMRNIYFCYGCITLLKQPQEWKCMISIQNAGWACSHHPSETGLDAPPEIQRPHVGWDTHEPRSSHWSFCQSEIHFSFRVWVMILEPWCYLQLKWVTRHWQLKSPWPGRNKHENMVGVHVSHWFTVRKEGEIYDRAHSKYSLALTFRIFLCDCSFLLSIFLWLFLRGGQRWTTTSPFGKTRPNRWTVWMRAVLGKLSFMSRLLKHMFICSVAPSFSSPWVPSKKCTSIKIYS